MAEEKRVDWCASCNILKTEYPDFVMNGLNEEMCANLANNQGLDETKCVNNCEVMHDIADCLIGGFIESIDTYDFCDTKEMMIHFATNMMNVIDVLLCSHCGQWEQIEALWDSERSVESTVSDIEGTLDDVYTKAEVDAMISALTDNTKTFTRTAYTASGGFNQATDMLSCQVPANTSFDFTLDATATKTGNATVYFYYADGTSRAASYNYTLGNTTTYTETKDLVLIRMYVTSGGFTSQGIVTATVTYEEE